MYGKVLLKSVVKQTNKNVCSDDSVSMQLGLSWAISYLFHVASSGISHASVVREQASWGLVGPGGPHLDVWKLAHATNKATSVFFQGQLGLMTGF